MRRDFPGGIAGSIVLVVCTTMPPTIRQCHSRGEGINVSRMDRASIVVRPRDGGGRPADAIVRRSYRIEFDKAVAVAKQYACSR